MQADRKSHASGQSRPYSRNILRFMGRSAKVFLVYVLSLVLATQPLLAQSAQIQVDANAAAANRPNIGAAANGVPLVNIVKPNAAGLSHNKYNQFNVGTPGAILNNSNANLANSQLGGLVQGNANLRLSGPARVILNEVTGASRSQLRGTVEVHGSSADVVIANPNGITCNGCGFINTPRVTLSTGTPEIGAGGNLLSLNVNGGDILIGENGANLETVNVFDIVSRSISVEGSVKAGSALNLIAGRNSYAYQTGLITPLASDGNEPAIAIDSSLLGGMYAGRIKLISTDKGAGVNMQGQMAANTAGMTLSADGKLRLRKARAKGRITAQSTTNDVVVEETLFSEDSIELQGVSGVTINDNGFVGASNDVTITGGPVTINANAIVAAGTNENGQLGTRGNLLITASRLTAGNGQLVGAGSLRVSAALIDLTRGSDTGTSSLRSLGSLTLETDRINASNGRVSASGILSILSANGLTLSQGFYESASAVLVNAPAITSSATLRSASTVTLQGTAGDISNSGIVAGDTGTTVTASNDITNSGEFQSNATVTVIAGSTLTNEASGKIAGVTGTTITAATLNNRGQINADSGILAFNITGTANNTGAVSSGGTIDVNIDGQFTNSGEIAADSALLVQGLTGTHAGAFSNLSGGEINTASPSFFVASLVNEGVINAHTGGVVLDSTGGLTNTGTISSQANSELRLDGSITNSGTIEAEGLLTLTGRNGGRFGTLTTALGSFTNGTGGLTLQGQAVFNAGGIGSADGALLVELSGNLSNTGVIYTGTSLDIRADGNVTNTNADIVAETDITIRGLSVARAGTIVNNSANIEAITGNLSITAASLENKRSQYSIGTTTSSTRTTSGATTTTTTTTREILTNATAPGQILAGGNILIDTSGAVTNTYSQIAANGDITINAASVSNSGQDLIETIVVRRDTQRSRRYCARRVLGFCVRRKTRYWIETSTSTSSNTYDDVYATVEAGGTLTANVTGFVTNESVRQGAGQIGLSSGDRALNGGIAGNADTLSNNDLSDLQMTANNLLGRSALFETITDPNAPFLIETRSQFIDPSQFLGSDYFLSQIGGYNADLELKRFGDAYAETRLIRDQLFEQTGKRFLGEQSDERVQMQQLYDNAVDAQKDLGLTFGIALTPAQQVSLTQDIIWLEAQTVAGQRVLTPRVYLAAASRQNTDLNSARLAANVTQLNAQTVANSGQIAGWSGIEINTTGSTANFGGNLTSNADIAIRAGGTFDNTSGTIDGENISVTAANVINSTAVIRDTWFNGYTDRQHQVARIKAQGNLEIDTTGSYTAVGSDTTAGGNLTIKAGDTITIAALGLETWRDDKIDGGYSRESSFTNRKATITAGGNASITGNGEVGIAGADIRAGNDVDIASETGNVTITAVQDRHTSSLRLTIETGGFLGTKTEIERDSASSTTQASTVIAGNDVTITSQKQNITIQASEVESGDTTTLLAEQGQVALLANKDTDFKQDKKREEDIGWWNSRDQGHNRETIQHVKINAGGGLKIVAGQGVIAEIEATGSLDGAISQLSQKPGMSWVGQLRQREDVEWRKIKPVLDEWDHKEQGLTEAGAALVALAVAAVSAGTLTQFSAALASALPAGIQPAAAAALKAGMSSMLSRASVSMINNGGNLGAVLKELGSSGSLKALATAMLSAGLTTGVAGAAGLSSQVPAGLPQISQDLQYNLVRAAVSTSVSTAINGGKFGDNLTTNLRLAAASTIGATLAKDIHAASEVGDLNAVTKLVAHAALGCATGAIASGNCGSGAAGAVTGEIVGEIYRGKYDKIEATLKKATALASQDGILTATEYEQLRSLETYLIDLRNQGIDVAALAGGLAAAVSGGDVDTGSDTAENSSENNALCGGVCIGIIAVIAAGLEIADRVVIALDGYALSKAIANGDEEKAAEIGAELAITGGVEVLAGIVPGSAIATKIALKLRKKGFDNVAEKLTEQLDSYDGISGFYNPQAWRKNYEDFYNGNVTSTTVPPFGAKNVHLAGKRHPDTGIVFDERGFPIFDDIARYDTKFGADAFNAMDYQGQMRMATRNLRDQVSNNPQLIQKFDADQLQAIQSGKANIPRLTWHHHQNPGRMQLVDRDIHKATGHVGGESLSKGK